MPRKSSCRAGGLLSRLQRDTYPRAAGAGYEARRARPRSTLPSREAPSPGSECSPLAAGDARAPRWPGGGIAMPGMAAPSHRPSGNAGARRASGGHSRPSPSQASAMSHASTACRQTAPSECTVSTGQPSRTPSQRSSRSHAPEAGRHTVAGECRKSGGQASLVPSHTSATSQGPRAGRHVSPRLASAGHTGDAPSHRSSRSQGPPAGRHTAPVSTPRSGGQVAFTPSHSSSRSQAPWLVRFPLTASALGCKDPSPSITPAGRQGGHP